MARARIRFAFARRRLKTRPGDEVSGAVRLRPASLIGDVDDLEGAPGIPGIGELYDKLEQVILPLWYENVRAGPPS